MIVIPFITIATTSVKKNLGKGLFEANNFTTMHWTKIFGRDDIIESLINSITFAAAAATIGIVISFTMAYLLQRTAGQGPQDPGLPHHAGLRHAQCGHRPGPDHDHERQVRH